METLLVYYNSLSNSHMYTLVNNIFKHIIFVLHFQRPDKRKPYEYRLLKIKFGHEWGNCTVTLGNTQIMVQLFHNIVRPKQHRPCKGKFQIHLNLTGQSQVPSEMTKIKEVLKKFYIKSKYIDLKALCITPGEKVLFFLHF